MNHEGPAEGTHISPHGGSGMHEVTAPHGEHGERATGTPNATFDLISVLYHALEGSATYARYIQDAHQEGDQELAHFFEQVQQEDRERAERAKALLARRLTQAHRSS